MNLGRVASQAWGRLGTVERIAVVGVGALSAAGIAHMVSMAAAPATAPPRSLGALPDMVRGAQAGDVDSVHGVIDTAAASLVRHASTTPEARAMVNEAARHAGESAAKQLQPYLIVTGAITVARLVFW